MRSMGRIWMAAAVALVLFACGSDGGDGSPGDHDSGSTSLKGSLVGPGGESGILAIEIETDVAALSHAFRGHTGEGVPQGAAIAHGTITWPGGGDPVGLTGSLNGQALDLSGGGFQFFGTWGDGRMTGTYSGPNGSGRFAADVAADVRVFCGTYLADGGTDSGTWNVVVTGAEMIGLSRSATGTDTDALTGSLAEDGTFALNGGDAQGVITGDEVVGTYDTGSSRGTFEGTRCDG